MEKFDISSFIIPTDLDTNTKDMVFLDDRQEVEHLTNKDLQTNVSSYASFYNITKDKKFITSKGKSGTAGYRLRKDGDVVNSEGKLDRYNYADFEFPICPAMHLNIQNIISAKQIASNFFKVKPTYNKKGEILYHTIEFGEYPQSKASNSETLEKLFEEFKITPTGKSYAKVGLIDSDLEYEYRGHKYVRVECYNKVAWFKVEPIKWIIRNWDEMPTELNPNGKGTAKYIDVRAEEIINKKMLFNYDSEPYPKYWQNSMPRAFLNGYNIFKQLDLGNGDIKYKNKKNFNFENDGFPKLAFEDYIKTAFNIKKTIEEKEEIKEEKKKVVQSHEKNPYNFSYKDLNNDELINAYIQSNAAIFLHGSSGVGKSSRVRQIDPTATRITLRPQMNPEEIDGTLDRRTGKYIPPLWYKQLCEKCEKEPNRKHVLFIDELTNVKPTVQSLIYSIVLDRAGKDGLWPLPENAVVVAAGNESVDNLAAYPLTNALFRRFSHIYYKVNKQDWLNWATDFNDEKPVTHFEAQKKNRAKVHPMIVAYIMSRDKSILNQDLDEENPKIVTDPRKWEIASNVLYTTRNPYALRPAIGEEFTMDFISFIKSIQLTVEDVINYNYDEINFKEMNLSKQYATLAGLCTATEKELPVVRKFILNSMGENSLTVYDSLWVRNDPERAEVIEEMNLQLLEEEQNNEY